MPDGSIFIDWLTATQNHLGTDLPIVCDGVKARGDEVVPMEQDGEKYLILVANDRNGYSYTKKSHRGSHDTHLLCQCNGSRVYLSGNVGRWERPDNVWNYDLAGTIAKANAYLADHHGLPGFTPGEIWERQTLSARDNERGVNPWVWSGCRFKELHVTQNYAVGSDALAVEWFRHVGGRKAARLQKGRYGHTTVVFGRQGGRLHKRIVVYGKAEEMLAHAKGDEAKARVKKSEEYQFARECGLVRIECKWGDTFLREKNALYLGDHCELTRDETGSYTRLGEPTMARVISLFKAETGFLLDAEPDRALRVVSDIPAKVRLTAMSWIRGEDVRALLPRATFFRHAKALRDYGIDISEPRDAHGRPNAEEALQRMVDSLPQFRLHALPAPEWYGLPEVERRAA